LQPAKRALHSPTGDARAVLILHASTMSASPCELRVAPPREDCSQRSVPCIAQRATHGPLLPQPRTTFTFCDH
jgi:hypothetical protein